MHKPFAFCTVKRASAQQGTVTANQGYWTKSLVSADSQVLLLLNWWAIYEINRFGFADLITINASELERAGSLTLAGGYPDSWCSHLSCRWLNGSPSRWPSRSTSTSVHSSGIKPPGTPWLPVLKNLAVVAMCYVCGSVTNCCFQCLHTVHIPLNKLKEWMNKWNLWDWQSQKCVWCCCGHVI